MLASLVQSEGIVDLFNTPALTMCLGYPHSDLGYVWELHPFIPTQPPTVALTTQFWHNFSFWP